MLEAEVVKKYDTFNQMVMKLMNELYHCGKACVVFKRSL